MSREQANAQAVEAMIGIDPQWVDVSTAIDVVPGMTPVTILHAGPPIAFCDMCDTMQGAVIGALLFEGLARTPHEAETLAKSGTIAFAPNHERASVSPMCGITSAHMPVCIVEDAKSGKRAYTVLCDDDDGGLKFGSYDQAALQSLKWARDALLPCFKDLLASTGPIALAPIMNEALNMGDELHLRTQSAGLLLVKELLMRSRTSSTETLACIVNWGLRLNKEHFLNFAMATCKLAGDSASGIENSGIVTAITRNGVESGIKIAAFPDTWFTAPAPHIDGVYRDGYTERDANLDIGDSAIMETLGFGGSILSFSPMLPQGIGINRLDDARRHFEKSRRISSRTHPFYQVSIDERHGLPIGLDVAKVVESGCIPVLTTAIAHKRPGHPQIGAGISAPPLELYVKAYAELKRCEKR